jgi:Glycosyl hydrolase family 65 central catalytic domain
VSGLGSDSYAGQVFWDAEVWMQPGLVATFPYAAKGISNYRVARFPQAQANIKTAYQSSKNKTHFSDSGAIYSWTSGRYGNCTATGPCWDYEYHINGDIALAFTNYWLTSGDTSFFRNELFPVHDAIATTYSEVLQKNGSYWSLTNATDPDEFANQVDNAAFTQALISHTLDTTNFFRSMFNQPVNDTWTSQAQNVFIGRDKEANILLEFSGMNGTVDVKQADVVLITYPLSYTGSNYTANDSLSDLDYYAAKQSLAGPAMTYSIFSIVANRVSPSGCSAYTYQQYASQPYARAPWFQFSEQLVDLGENPAYPFLTGHGGANQVVLFGYLGLRLIPTSPSLHISPALPPQIPHLRYRTFHFQGWPISAFSNQTHTTLSRNSSLSPAEGAVPNTTFTKSPITVIVGDPTSTDTQKTFSLSQDSSITVPNRMYAFERTVPDNIAQCQTVTSPDPYLPGQFPIAAVDGAASTKWQPVFANKTTSITVSIPAGYKVLSMGFDWAQAPPYNYSVRFHNQTDGKGVVVSSGDVNISSPYDPVAIATIIPVGANKTSVNITGAQGGGRNVYTANYATLSIWGSWFEKGSSRKHMAGDGASVAEWTVVVEGAPSGMPEGAEGGPVKRDEDVVGRMEKEMLGMVGRYNREWVRRKTGSWDED